MAKQTKITKSAKGEDCTLLLGNCSSSETVVLCHIGKNRGMAFKCSDHFAVYGCSNCHKIIDGQVKSEFSQGELSYVKLVALERTQQKLIDKGLLCLKL
jgi:geranylgeranyl pyrophosphate synthase